MGRISTFNEDIATKLCDRIAAGESLRKICTDPKMPSMATVMRWLGKPENAAFREQYACARDAQADKLVEEMLEIADEECTMVRSDKHGSKDDDGQGNTEVVFDATAVARNKLRVDARKWVASKMAPKKYGDKVTQEVVGAGGGPVETVTRIELVPLK
ncbi:putative terminase small subunit protein [Delftia acidovorans SPH-1]|uniref:Putative terminase small subunit protein n=1 Tax=Delftia acidovorans (strain DSM 14801 / SPH-1) TaxID=398578 RepID=A9BYN8_DELAS|nr:putative terminase small subunit protein [Delftia acidovorans SPH-1]